MIRAEPMMVWMPEFVNREVVCYLIKDSSFSQFAHKDNIRDRPPVLSLGFVPLLEMRGYLVHFPKLWILGLLNGEIDKVEQNIFN